MRARLTPVALLLAIAVTLAVVYRDQFEADALETWLSSAWAAAPLLFGRLHARHRIVPARLCFNARRRRPFRPHVGDAL